MVILKPSIKSGSQLFGQATCVFLHVACPNSKNIIHYLMSISSLCFYTQRSKLLVLSYGVIMRQLANSNKKLYRSRKEKMIAGVCGGLAKYFNTDPTWIRMIFILLLLMGGSALLVYLIMWVIVPLEP